MNQGIVHKKRSIGSTFTARHKLNRMWNFDEHYSAIETAQATIVYDFPITSEEEGIRLVTRKVLQYGQSKR